MQSESHYFQLDQNCSLTLDGQSARILQLKLMGAIIISCSQSPQELSSGCYLMYPWVNRLNSSWESQSKPKIQVVFKDNNGLPLHGTQVNAKRVLEISEKSSQKILIKLSSSTPHHQIIQQYCLERNKLTVSFHAKQIETQNPFIFCFGYHPFLQINSTKINQMEIQTNIDKNLKLTEALLPQYPFEYSEMQIKSCQQYDHLFKYTGEDPAFVQLQEKEGNRKIRISSPNLKYWQIYTPPDGIRIAIEPMSFCGNLYEIASKEGITKLQNEGEFSIIIS